MSEAVSVGLLTAAATLAAVVVQRIFEERKRKCEDKRWYADHFLGRKIDALATLYSELVDWQHELNQYGNFPPKTLEEYRTSVQARGRSFERAMVLSMVYLDQESQDIIRDVFAAFRQTNFAIWLSLPDDQIPNVDKTAYEPPLKTINWERFVITYDKATDCLTRLLNPGLLSSLETLGGKTHRKQ
jgi:hypothetical protein